MPLIGYKNQGALSSVAQSISYHRDVGDTIQDNRSKARISPGLFGDIDFKRGFVKLSSRGRSLPRKDTGANNRSLLCQNLPECTERGCVNKRNLHYNILLSFRVKRPNLIAVNRQLSNLSCAWGGVSIVGTCQWPSRHRQRNRPHQRNKSRIANGIANAWINYYNTCTGR